MCGYVGFLDHSEDKEQIVKKMMDTIVHRGPDSEGIYSDGEIALGFRRLSIIGLEDGFQPMSNENDRLHLVFNGEIYNYKVLKEELLQKGHIFKSHADTEVLLHLYEEYGTAMLNRLRGMFSFVLWDEDKKMLFGARDYFGIKPLYYAQMDGSFMFGSEIKSFMPHPAFKKELNEAALETYLSFQYSALPETFFKNVYRLYPAHFFTLQDGKMHIERYWEPSFSEVEKPLEEYVEMIHEVFEDSVAAHKISDVEVASFLSSGVDSSYATACLKVDKTFTVGFSFQKYNEISYAKDLAGKLGIDCYNKVITPEEYWAVLPKIQYHMDEPLGDASAVALYFVSGIAAEHVKVVLSGEGADELFGGYQVYSQPYSFVNYYKLPKFLRKLLGNIAWHMPDVKGKKFFINGSESVQQRFIGNANIFREKERKKILKHPTKTISNMAITGPIYEKVKDKHIITQMQYLDIHMWLQGDILLKADKMSMAHSLELRVPFLDKEVMRVAGMLPLKYRVQPKVTKVAMRLAAQKMVPAATANKPKLGFPVPIREWLKQDHYQTIVKEAFTSAAAQKYFDTEALLKLLKDHYNLKKDNSRKIWTIYMFLVWYDQFFAEAS
ncbi:MAG: asparagine synthase (glutamine-hydrolyzing) [Vallitaleaceae bacterium]|nr:asparagine synthase (glutamine-hydrolyzing) [Vallitaleaceae bacterium]